MNEMKTLPLAFTYVGVFLGAGFVSGPELWQFFGAFGNWGYVGFLLAAVLFTLFGILLVRPTPTKWIGCWCLGISRGCGQPPALWRRPSCSAWWSLWRRDPGRY